MRTIQIIDATDFNQVANIQVTFRLYKNDKPLLHTITGKNFDAMTQEARNHFKKICGQTDGLSFYEEDGSYRDHSANMIIADGDESTEWSIFSDNYTIVAEIKEMDVYVIVDSSANNGKCYIGDGNSNVELLENAILFDSEGEANEYIESHEGWEDWASVSCEKIDMNDGIARKIAVAEVAIYYWVNCDREWFAEFRKKTIADRIEFIASDNDYDTLTAEAVVWKLS